MSRLRIALMLVSGILFLLSSVAHSVMGWPNLAMQLDLAGAPTDLVRGLAVGWNFSGVMMALIGLLAVKAARDAHRGRPVEHASLVLIGLTYGLFGIAAAPFLGSVPFALVFVVPGLLLAGASWPTARLSARTDR